MTPADVQAMINQAYEQVDAIDWSRWVPDQRDRLLTHRVTGDKPPLTLLMVADYVNFYAWVWQRKPPGEEVEWVTSRLIDLWTRSFIYMDYSGMRDVLAKIVLFAAIWEHPQREAIQTILRKALPEGSYGELEQRPQVPPGEAGSEVSDPQTDKIMRDSQLQNKLFIDVLRHMAGLPSRPPGFF
jgi:hypothetical protein